MKEYEQKINNIINNAKEDVIFQAHQAYEQGYATGYDRGNEDGLKDGQESLVNAYVVGKGTLGDIEKAEYSRGLTDAWNAAKKVNEIDADVYDKLFPMALTEGFYESYTVKEVIEKLAEYEDKQKYGKWIKAKPWMIDNTSYKWECSECEKSERFRHNYCPNCGAKMQESEDIGQE